MFRFEQGETPGNYRIVDADRRVSFRVVGGMVQSMAELAVLSWDGRDIPLEIEGVKRTDSVSGKSYQLYRFNTFGDSWEVTRRLGVGAYVFRDTQERADALRLAVEAVLVNNYRYVDGAWNVDSTRVEAEGREWRASDFGYRTSSDIAGDPR